MFILTMTMTTTTPQNSSPIRMKTLRPMGFLRFRIYTGFLSSSSKLSTSVFFYSLKNPCLSEDWHCTRIEVIHTHERHPRTESNYIHQGSFFFVFPETLFSVANHCIVTRHESKSIFRKLRVPYVFYIPVWFTVKEASRCNYPTTKSSELFHLPV